MAVLIVIPNDKQMEWKMLNIMLYEWSKNIRMSSFFENSHMFYWGLNGKLL